MKLPESVATPRVTLVLQSLDAVRAWIGELPAEVQKELSPLWLERLRQATEPSPWICMFNVHRNSDNTEVGQCGFKGPPDEHGMVEIGYGIADAYQRQGLATDAIAALVQFAQRSGAIVTLRAHTKQENVASQRVLEKNGFQSLGQFIDPEDGEVDRYEFSLSPSAA